MMKIKLFTHNDLDGYGCSLILKYAFGDTNVDADYCNYSNINILVKKFFNSNKYKEYDYVFITDISISMSIANWLNTITDKIVLLDHHKSVEALNQFNWCTVTEMGEKEETCGTELVYNYLLKNFNNYIQSNDFLDLLVYTIRLYDTWLFKTKYDYSDSQKLQHLFNIYGGTTFINIYLTRLECHDFILFSDQDDIIYNIEKEKIKRYIEEKNVRLSKLVLTLNGNKYAVGVSFGEQYISETGNGLCELNPDLDFIIIVNNLSTLSFRTIKDIDVGQIAEYYNGGGHPKSAGAPINNEFKKQFLSKLLV